MTKAKKEKIKKVNKGHKKGIITTIVICVLTTILVVGANIFVNYRHEMIEKEKEEKAHIEEVTAIANDFLDEVERLKIDYTGNNMETGTLLDVSLATTIDDYFYYFDDKYMLTEGKIFLDIYNEITVVSNLKIDDVYCVYKDDKFTCSRDYKKNTDTDKIKFASYKIGDAVTLKDGSKWHVVRNSSEYSEYVYLLYDSTIAPLNTYPDNGNVDDYDTGWQFDASNRNYYYETDSKNIAYWLENDIKDKFKLEEDFYLSILTRDEYIYLSDNLSREGLTAEVLNGSTAKHWFFNHTLRCWWLYDNDYNKASLSMWNNGFDESSLGSTLVVNSNSVYNLRPTMTVKKTAIQ